MPLLSLSYCSWRNSTFFGGGFTGPCVSPNILPSISHGLRIQARKNSRKSRKDRKSQNGSAVKTTKESLLKEDEALPISYPSEDNYGEDVRSSTVNISSRSAVLQACTVTSGFIAALGVVIRQVSHVASVEGLPILDCSTEVSFGIEKWHLQLIVGLVILISSSRYLLLKTWPDFAESMEAANKQVLTSLEPLDYLVVSLLPGVSEELLFRGALLPLFGMDWKSVFAAGSVFGILHLGSGRNYSFAIWATFVGIVYGYATIKSSSIIVPMASHALNNLVGGILWRQTSRSLD